MWDREHDEQPLGLLRLQPLFRVECGGDLPLGDRLIGCSSSCQTHVEKAQVISRTFPLHDRINRAVFICASFLNGCGSSLVDPFWLCPWASARSRRTLGGRFARVPSSLISP